MRILLSIAFIVSRKSSQKQSLNSITAALWIAWFFTALTYRILLSEYFFTPKFDIPLSERPIYYGVATIVFVISTSLFCLAIYFSAKSLSESSFLKHKWLLVGFGLANLFATFLYIISNLVPMYEGRYQNIAWRTLYNVGNFMLFVKIFGIPIIGIISLVLALREIKESIRSAREYFAKTDHSSSIIFDECLRVKEYRELLDYRLDMEIEQELQEHQIDMKALEIFSSRATNYSFILFVPRNIKKLNKLVIEFLQIAQANPDIEMLFYNKLDKRRHKKMHSIQWNIEGEIEELFEFNFNELLAIFIIDKTLCEIGKIEGNLPKKADLLDGLIYYTDVGGFSES